MFGFYPALPRPLRNWLKNNFFLYAAVIIALFALAFLGVWAVTNLVVPAQQSLVNTTLYDGTMQKPTRRFKFGPNQEYALEARYPSLLLADGPATTSTLALYRPPTSTDELITITMTVPADLLRADAPEQPDIALGFPPGQVMTRTFGLISAQTNNSFLWSDIPLTLTFQLSSTADTYTATLKFRTEGAWAQTGRHFVNSTVNEKSPLIILVAGLLSGAGATSSSFLKQQKEKGEERKKESERAVDQFKTAIRSRNKEAVNKIWKELARPDLAENISAG